MQGAQGTDITTPEENKYAAGHGRAGAGGQRCMQKGRHCGETRGCAPDSAESRAPEKRAGQQISVELLGKMVYDKLTSINFAAVHAGSSLQ